VLCQLWEVYGSLSFLNQRVCVWPSVEGVTQQGQGAVGGVVCAVVSACTYACMSTGAAPRTSYRDIGCDGQSVTRPQPLFFTVSHQAPTPVLLQQGAMSPVHPPGVLQEIFKANKGGVYVPPEQTPCINTPQPRPQVWEYVDAGNAAAVCMLCCTAHCMQDTRATVGAAVLGIVFACTCGWCSIGIWVRVRPVFIEASYERHMV
jgi:hypothetical protein